MMRFKYITPLLLFVSLLGFFGGNKKETQSNSGLWVERSETDKRESTIPLPSLNPLVKRAEPAVLVVTTEQVLKQPQQNVPPEFERGPFKDFFRFFGPPQGGQPEHRAKGQGSGFIIHPSGLALTNHHVVENATTIKVKVGKSLKEYEAKVIGSDEATDVALIQIKSDRTDWPVIPLGNSSTLLVGDFAVAIGNPLGLELSVTFGNVSARGRHDINPSGRNGLYDFIQISNPINPGNSGGPLLNLAGEAVGINTAISASGRGIAFAIPINQVKQILPSLKSTGKAIRSWIGVKISDVGSDLSKEMGLKFPHGALVSEVVPGGPAAKAGLEPGDIITKFNNQTIKDASSLQVLAGLAGVGKKIKLEFVHDKKEKNTHLVLEAYVGLGTNASPGVMEQSKPDITGVSLKPLDEQTRKSLNLKPTSKGILVASVAEHSPAAMAGLQAGDVITKLNGKKIDSIPQYSSIRDSVKPGGTMMVLLKRGNATIFTTFKKPAATKGDSP